MSSMGSFEETKSSGPFDYSKLPAAVWSNKATKLHKLLHHTEKLCCEDEGVEVEPDKSFRKKLRTKKGSGLP